MINRSKGLAVIMVCSTQRICSCSISMVSLTKA
ncbi:hypothetical protein MSL71_47120 [Desulfoluna butyratoxydans]|uniref:Uncharacterized protein n=1 Tax=Desulfoluna butyratoxydans TaxID=231438 RepID=A0A4U8YUE1_9BACT|nr:hypothetical protein MSL71_47120 [Desulfoluna butyratoxydans]